MKVNNQIFYDRLKELEVIEISKLDECFVIAEKNNKKLIEVLFDKDLATDEQLGSVLADLYEVPFVNLEKREINEDILSSISIVFAKEQEIVVFDKNKEGLHIATSDPENNQAIEFVAKKTGLPLKIYLATSRDIKTVLDNFGSGLGDSFEGQVNKFVSMAMGGNDSSTPIISLLDLIMEYSSKNRASDVHFEAMDKESIIRFRIDSILHDVVRLPLEIHLQLLTRIKVVAKLRTDEHMMAQDGKFQFEVEGDKTDVRVSITPTVNGEKVVMRLLSSNRQFSLINLGLGEEELKKVEKAYKKPFGMILATGPTGSGKTTSLYSILKLLNTREVNIMTIEDPVEYEVEGVNQIQVNLQSNLTFADGLRSIVRQDPNVILVGEIRDAETAQIATQAAMTGHLVLSTLHTNDAATTIPRLLEMGIEPFIIASGVNCVMAQRLVRQICTKCRTSKEYSKTDLDNLNTEPEMQKLLLDDKKSFRAYFGKGCPICHETGFVGRIGIFEVMLVEGEVREAVVAKKDANDIFKLAVKAGMKPMMNDGVDKILAGTTTLEEVLRVIKV